MKKVFDKYLSWGTNMAQIIPGPLVGVCITLTCESVHRFLGGGGLFYLSSFVRFLFVFDLLFILFRIAFWPSAGKSCPLDFPLVPFIFFLFLTFLLIQIVMQLVE